MSHFNVAVFTRKPDDLEGLLEPFNEDVGVDSPYAVFEEDADGEMNEVLGKRGCWHNPNAKWDWWVLGGRWRGQLKLKEGRTGIYGKVSWMNKDAPVDTARCDQALVADCDFSADPKAYEQALRTWEILVEGSPLRDGEKETDYLRLYKPEYYIRQYGTKEDYARSLSMFNTFAFVTATGEWHEAGSMGWFGIDSSTADSRKAYQEEFAEYLKEAGVQGLYISIVDMHI